MDGGQGNMEGGDNGRITELRIIRNMGNLERRRNMGECAICLVVASDGTP